MKKKYIIPITIFAILVITNPSIDALYDYLPSQLNGSEQSIRKYARVSRDFNFMIFSIYSVRIGKTENYYLGVISNFIKVN